MQLTGQGHLIYEVTLQDINYVASYVATIYPSFVHIICILGVSVQLVYIYVS